MTLGEEYKKIAEKKKQLRNERFKKEWLVPSSELPSPGRADKDVTNWINESGFLPQKEIRITEANCLEIVSMIREKKWRSVEVIDAFCHRATLAQQLVNCLSEVLFDEAIETARALDKFQDETGEVKGPMHGLPISLKDNFNIKGQATTLGMVDFSFNPRGFETDATLVEILRDLGAVVYVKTNVPVAMMMPETINHIYGETSNPLNTNLSAGGSSGGECALLALKGSPLGVGSDIGGSIRIPASFQNLYGLKPSLGRFPTYNCRSGLPGLESVSSVNGPISPSIESLEFYCKCIIGSEPWNHDPKMIPLPWRDVNIASTLNIGIVEDDGWVRPTPPVLRGVKIVRDALRLAGHEVIEWETTDHLEMSQVVTKFFLSDGGKHVINVLDKTGEPFFPYMKMYGKSPEIGTSDLWELHSKRTLLQKRYLERWNDSASKTKNGRPIDCIILPVTPFAGNPKGKFHDYVGYTSPFNALDYSAITIPVTRVVKEKDLREDSSTNRNPTDFQVWKDYDPEESNGGAVALQIVCRRLEEEKVVEIAKIITKILQG